MRIAVLSDTHDRLPRHVCAAIGEAEEIWHLGDVCEQGVCELLGACGPPLRIVRGNCDSNPAWPHVLDFECEGFQVELIHIPPRTAPPGVQLLFHGHTHVPRDEKIGATRFFNPGCITRPNRGASASYAWLELKKNEAPIWSLVKV